MVRFCVHDTWLSFAWEFLKAFEKPVTAQYKITNLYGQSKYIFEPCYLLPFTSSVIFWNEILFTNKQTNNLILSDKVELVEDAKLFNCYW